MKRKNIDGELLKNEFVKFKSEIIEIFKNPMKKNFLEYFDIISCIESKIKNRSFEKVLKDNAASTKRKSN